MDQIEVIHLASVWKSFVASSIKDIFDNIEAQKIIVLIKETRFYKQLKCFHINVCYLFFYILA